VKTRDEPWSMDPAVPASSIVARACQIIRGGDKIDLNTWPVRLRAYALARTALCRYLYARLKNVLSS